VSLAIGGIESCIDDELTGTNVHPYF